MASINIAVVGDGPIGNLVISRLLIEHYKNNKEDSKDIKIAHHTSTRIKDNGYTRRHILFITDKLVKKFRKKMF